MRYHSLELEVQKGNQYTYIKFKAIILCLLLEVHGFLLGTGAFFNISFAPILKLDCYFYIYLNIPDDVIISLACKINVFPLCIFIEVIYSVSHVKVKLKKTPYKVLKTDGWIIV